MVKEGRKKREKAARSGFYNRAEIHHLCSSGCLPPPPPPPPSAVCQLSAVSGEREDGERYLRRRAAAITLWCRALQSLNHQRFDNQTDRNSFPIAAAPAHFLAIKPGTCAALHGRPDRCEIQVTSRSFRLLLTASEAAQVSSHRLSRRLLMAS